MRAFATAALAFVAAAVAAHAALFPLKPEFPIGAPPIVPEQQKQFYPATASSGDEVLVVWNDMRDVTAVVAARVDAAGRLLDDHNLVISTTITSNPSVAWNGENFVVSAATPVAGKLAQYSWIVDRSGRVVNGPSQIGIGPGEVYGNGHDALFVSAQTAIFLNADGTPGTQFDLPFGLYASPAVVAEDSFFSLYGISASKQLERVRLSRDGSTVQSLGFMHGNEQLSASGNGSVHLLAWSVYEISYAGSTTNVHFTVTTVLISNDGTMISLPAAVVDTKTTVPLSYYAVDAPAVTWDGTRFMLAWTAPANDGRSVTSSVVTAAVSSDGTATSGIGSLIDSVPMNSAAARRLQPSFAPLGAATILVWQSAGIAGRIFTTLDSIATASTLNIARAPLPHVQTDIRSDDQGTVALWTEGESQRRVGMQLLGKSGEPLAQVMVGNPAASGSDPVVAIGGNVYMVVWVEDFGAYGGINAQRFDRHGNALDSSPMVIDDSLPAVALPDHRRTAVAWDGAAFVIAWVSHDGSIWAKRLDANGAAVGQPVQMSSGGASGGPRVVAVGTGTIIGWMQINPGDLTAVRVAGLSADGKRVTLRNTDVTYADSNSGSLELSWNGRDLLLVKAVGDPTQQQCLVAYRLAADGSVTLGRTTLSCGVPSQSDPRAIWDGESWWVVAAPLGTDRAAELVQFDRDLHPLGSPFVLRGGADFPWQPGIAAAPNRLLVLYTRYDESAARRAYLATLLYQARRRSVHR